MTSFVVDASVAAKWFLPRGQETFTQEARDLLNSFVAGNCRLLVPDLFWAETGNILWEAARNGRLPAVSCSRALQELAGAGITTFPCQPLLNDAVAIALTYDRTVYDAVYVALAATSNAPLVTADERLANALAARFPIRWLGSLSI